MSRGRPRKNPLFSEPSAAPSIPDAVIQPTGTETASTTLFTPASGNSNAADLQSRFEAELAKLESPVESQKMAEPKEEPTPESEDPLEKEIEDAAAAAKVEVVEEPEEEKKDQPEEDEKKSDEKQDETDAPDGGDEYQKWLNTLSKPAKARIERQQRQISKLTAAAANSITIAPTQQSPLSHVTTPEALDAERSEWEVVRNEARKLTKEIEIDPDTNLTIKTPGGRVYKFNDAEELANAEAYAVHVLDAVPEAKVRILDRAAAKPWDEARKLVPDIFEKDSEGYKHALEFLGKVPQIASLPDYEIKVAHMLRSMQMESEEKSGKAKWVRLELDEKGRAKLPKKAAPPKQESKTPSAPSATRPALSSNGSGNLNQKIAALQKSGSDEDLRAAVAEMLKGG